MDARVRRVLRVRERGIRPEALTTPLLNIEFIRKLCGHIERRKALI
jgi:hypothetical protein